MQDFNVLTGNEVQINTFQVTIHSDTNLEEAKQMIRESLEDVYEGETAHPVIRCSYQRGRKMFTCNAGYEDQMQEDIDAYVEKLYTHEYAPIVLLFQCFVSFTPPRAVEN